MAKKNKDYEKRESQMMIEFLEKSQVLREWDLNVKKAKKIKHNYKIKTQRGEKLLKVSFQEEQIMFMYLALEHLAGNGCFKGIPRLIPTKYGDFYIKSDIGIYYLIDWVEGKEGKRKDLDQVIDFVKFLGEIHLSSKNFEPVPKWVLRERWDDISDQIRLNTEKIRSRLTQLPQELQEAWPNYASKAQKAQSLLNISGYQSLKERAKRDMTLCHGQFAPGHGLVSKESIHMLNWEHCAYGVQISDLVYFMEKTMPSFEWNYQVGREIIKAYHQIKPLLREEIMTMGAALIFPVNFIKLAEKFFRGKLKEDEIKAKLEKMQNEEEKKDAFLEQLFLNYDLKGFFGGENVSPLSNAWYLVSSKDLKRSGEGDKIDISGILLKNFTVSAQGRIKEESGKLIHRISKEYQVPVFPVVDTGKSPEERENVMQVLADDYLRKRLLDEIDDMLKENDFAGVNIKFEILALEEGLSFNKFIGSLSQIVHVNEKLLLVSAAAAKGENMFYDYEELGKYCDYLLVEIMEEDLSFPDAPVSKEFIQSAIIYAAAYLPREKIVAVLPVHEESGESLLEKAFFARQFGIAGCAFWRLGLEDRKIWQREAVGGSLGKKAVLDEEDEEE